MWDAFLKKTCILNPDTSTTLLGLVNCICRYEKVQYLLEIKLYIKVWSNPFILQKQHKN
jgi:hypothetical protein